MPETYMYPEVILPLRKHELRCRLEISPPLPEMDEDDPIRPFQRHKVKPRGVKYSS
jgi:hypothetical protein